MGVQGLLLQKEEGWWRVDLEKVKRKYLQKIPKPPPGSALIGTRTAGPGEIDPPKSPIPGSSSGGTAVAEVEVEDQWLFSLTRRLNALGTGSYKLPEGWQGFDEVSFAFMLKDALSAVGLEPEDLPSEWATVVTKKMKKKKEKMLKLPNVPRVFLGKMYKRSSGPADDEEWEIDIYRRCCNLRADDNFKFTDILEKLPTIPVDHITDVETKTRRGTPPSVSDDEAWTHDIYRRHRNLRSRFDVPTKKEILESRELHKNLPVDEFGLPELPASHHTTFDLEERFQRLKTNPVTPSRGPLPLEFLSGYVDMSKVPDAAHHLDSKRKENKKTRKKAKKRLDREAQMHLAEAKKLMEEAQEIKESIDYCERNPDAYNFAVQVNQKQTIKEEESHTDDTEDFAVSKKKTSTSIPSFAAAMAGVIMNDIEKSNEKAKRDEEAERESRYAADTMFVQWNVGTSRDSSSSDEIGSFTDFAAHIEELPREVDREGGPGRLTTNYRPPPPNSGPSYETRPGPSQPRQLPKPEDGNIRMPYGDVLKSDTSWSLFK